jgi:hypothetical protein
MPSSSLSCSFFSLLCASAFAPFLLLVCVDSFAFESEDRKKKNVIRLNKVIENPQFGQTRASTSSIHPLLAASLRSVSCYALCSSTLFTHSFLFFKFYAFVFVFCLICLREFFGLEIGNWKHVDCLPKPCECCCPSLISSRDCARRPRGNTQQCTHSAYLFPRLNSHTTHTE